MAKYSVGNRVVVGASFARENPYVLPGDFGLITEVVTTDDPGVLPRYGFQPEVDRTPAQNSGAYSMRESDLRLAPASAPPAEEPAPIPTAEAPADYEPPTPEPVMDNAPTDTSSDPTSN